MNLETLLVKQDICDVLSRYCRALDRMDRELADTLWHREAMVDYVGVYRGTAAGFLDWVWQAHAGMQAHSHQVTNVLTHVDGDTATSEAYVTVALLTKPDPSGQQFEILSRGRYLDRWSRRDGKWAIDRRVHVADMQSRRPVENLEASGLSRRDRKDPSYEFLVACPPGSPAPSDK